MRGGGTHGRNKDRSGRQSYGSPSRRSLDWSAERERAWMLKGLVASSVAVMAVLFILSAVYFPFWAFVAFIVLVCLTSLAFQAADCQRIYAVLD